MPTAYSISEGIAIGVISWTLINLVTGKAKLPPPSSSCCKQTDTGHTDSSP